MTTVMPKSILFSTAKRRDAVRKAQMTIRCVFPQEYSITRVKTPTFQPVCIFITNSIRFFAIFTAIKAKN